MACGLEATTGAVVATIDVVAMRPAVVGVGVAFFGRILRVARGGGGGVVVVVVVATVVAPATLVVVGAIGEAGLKLLDLLTELREFGVFDRELLKQGLVGGLEATEHVTVGSGGSGKVGKCLRRFVGEGLHGVGIVGLMEAGCLTGVAHVAQVSVGKGEIELEVGPGAFVGRLATPVATRVDKHVRVEHDVVSVVDDLRGGVGLAGGVGKVHSVFDLLNEGLKGLVGVVGGFETLIVGVEVHGCHATVGGVEMTKERKDGNVGVAGVTILQGTKVNVRDGGEDLLAKGALDRVVETVEAEGL